MLGLKGAPALVRIARREVRRHPRRSSVIVALIAVPVGVVACGLTTQATMDTTGGELRTQELGGADLVVGEPDEGYRLDPDAREAGDPAAIERTLHAALPEGSQVVANHRTRLDVASDDRAAEGVVIATDAGHPINDGRFRVDQGRLPSQSGETALATDLARELNVAVGGSVTLHPRGDSLEVVGLARATNALQDATMVVPTGTIPATGWWIDLPQGTDSAASAGSLQNVPGLRNVRVRTADTVLRTLTPAGQAPAELFVVGVLALAWTGSVAAATFAISARSRLREVGLVAATGGTQRQVRRLLVADGLVLGLLGSILGLVAGVVVAAPVVAHLARSADRDPGSLQIPMFSGLGTVALGTLAAVLAARWPAVRAARMPTQAALQSRITRPPRRVRSTTGGALAMGAGAVLLTSGAASSTNALITTGTLLVVAGVAMLHRLLIDLVARLARSAPLALRFAARDASRQASRTGPAVVASMLALAAAVGATTIVSTARAREAASPHERGLYPPGRFEVWIDNEDTTASGTGYTLDPERDGPALEHTISEAVDAQRAGTIWWATAPPAAGAATPSPSRSEPPGIQVVTTEALTVLGVTDQPTLAAFQQGEALRIDSQTVSSPASITDAGGTDHQLPVVDVRDGTVGLLGVVAVSPETATHLGLTHTTSLSVIVDLGRPVRNDDLPRAHAAALRVIGDGPRIGASNDANSGYDQRSFALLALGAGLGVALPVLGLVAALTRSETRPELAVIDAVGIAPRRRRRFAAANTGLLAAFASALAVPAGLIPAALYLQADSPPANGPSVDVPWSALAVTVLAVPLVLAALGWLTAGRPRPLAILRH